MQIVPQQGPANVEQAFLPLLWGSFEPLTDPDEIAKAGLGSAPGEEGIIKGILTTEAVDLDGEEVDQDGLDFSFFLERGKLTAEHPAMPFTVVGEPISVTPIQVDGFKGHQMVARLYLHDRFGKAIWDKALALKKSNAKHGLGFSIEGKVLSKDGQRIQKAIVYTVAVSHAPKNRYTYFQPLAASVMAMVDLFRSYGAPTGMMANSAAQPGLVAEPEPGPNKEQQPPSSKPEEDKASEEPKKRPLEAGEVDEDEEEAEGAKVAKAVDLDLREALVKGVPTRDLKALRRLLKHPGRTLESARDWVDNLPRGL